MMNSVRMPRARILTWAISAALLTGSGMILTGCGGGEASFTAPEIVTAPDQAIFAFYEDDNGQRQVARIDPVTLEVLETKLNPINAPGGKQKSYFYENGYVWGVASSSVYALDPNTLDAIPGTAGPYIQGNRSGIVGPGLVNSVGVTAPASVQTAAYDPELAALLAKTSYTDEELIKLESKVDLCAIRQEAQQASRSMALWGGVGSLAVLTEDQARIHNFGYGNVGNENSPDGKLLKIAVRQGDHMLFIDTDPESSTFGKPVRFVYARYGVVKDQNNAVVSTFDSAYTAAGGTAPGNKRWIRATDAASAIANEIDRETYVEPCDSTMLRNHKGEVWSWTVDVDGDTLTGVNMAKINTAAPEVRNLKVPVVRQRNFTANIATAGPWMASLANRNTGAFEFLLFVEYEGENAEGIWDMTNMASPVEVQRMYNTLADVVDTPPASFVNGAQYDVSIKYASTGGTNTVVKYRYVALAGDTGTGASPVASGTTAYLQKVTATDPGPTYLLNGLTRRALTSIGTMSRVVGSGPDSIVYSDEVWLDMQSPTVGFDIVNLRTVAPWRITESIDVNSGPGHWFKDKFFQVSGGKIQVIDRTTRGLFKEISLGKGISNIAIGTYKRPQTAPGGGGTDGGTGGGGGGGVLPPNPCGG